jgi:hypothetical protein
LAYFAELAPNVVEWEGKIPSFLTTIAESPTKEKTLQVGMLTTACKLQICCTGVECWFVLVEGQKTSIEQFAHLLCAICGVKQEVVVDGCKNLSAQQATML